MGGRVSTFALELIQKAVILSIFANGVIILLTHPPPITLVHFLAIPINYIIFGQPPRYKRSHVHDLKI